MKNLQPLFPLIAILALVGLTMSQNKKRQRAAAAVAQALAPGVEVMTTSGIYGKVHDVTDTIVSLEIAPDTVIRVARGAVARVVEPEKAAAQLDAPSTNDDNREADKNLSALDAPSTNDEERA
jgi:preprotein translocase subunit YajC